MNRRNGIEDTVSIQDAAAEQVAEAVMTALTKKNCSKCGTTNEADAKACMVCRFTVFHPAKAYTFRNRAAA